MARREIIVDDIDGTPDAQPIEFAFDGASYVIDLSDTNRAKFETALEPYLKVASRKVFGNRKLVSPRRNPTELAAIREWWRSQGNTIGDRGRIPGSVQDAYDAAH